MVEYIIINIAHQIYFILSAGCAPNQFTCDNGQCIPGIYVCDNNEDCDDDSDEAESMCNSKYNYIIIQA